MSDDLYPQQYESQLVLKYGRELFVRPVVSSDTHLLVDLFNKMSPQSRYLRFMTSIHRLPEELLHQFTHLDYHNNFALACLVDGAAGREIIAVARYSLSPNERSADLGVAVRDDWQHLGIGRKLLSKIIAIGTEHGISRFVSMMDPHNDIMKKILRETGHTVKYHFSDGSFHVEIVI